MKNKILIALGIILGLGAIIGVILIAGGGNLLQGALYNIRPIYRECKIESKNFNSTNVDDCEHFYEKFQKGVFPDGEYSIFAKYTETRLGENVIPLKISGGQLSCNFVESGYQPEVNVSDPKNLTISQNLKDNLTVPVGTNGLVVQLNYRKDTNRYFYDTNICEGAFSAKIYDDENSNLGTAKLDWNGFINSRPLVNEILVTEKVAMSAGGLTVRQFNPGNLYAQINAIPEVKFKFTIPCSSNFPTVEIPNLETTTDLTIPFKGLTSKFLKVCSDRLYLSLQNANRYDDIQNIDHLNIDSQSELASYDLKLADIARLQDSNNQTPTTFLIKLLLRDRSDSNEVFQLGQGTLTVTDYTPAIVETISTSPASTATTTETTAIENEATPENLPASPAAAVAVDDGGSPAPASEKDKAAAPASPAAANENAISPAAANQNSVSPAEGSTPTVNKKVRRSPEAILVIPATTENTPSAAIAPAPIDVIEPVEPA